MSAESSFSYTAKVFGELLTIRDDDWDTFLGKLQKASNVESVKNIYELLSGIPTTTEQAVANVQQTFGEVTVIPTQSFAPVAPPAVATPTTNTTARTCAHGVMIGRKGNGAKGEWRGYFCNTPKGTPDQCKPEFVTRNTPEWNAIA